jgi:hypothetical protein
MGDRGFDTPKIMATQPPGPAMTGGQEIEDGENGNRYSVFDTRYSIFDI